MAKSILAAEPAVRSLGLRRHSRQVDEGRVEAVTADHGADELALDGSQAAMVRNLATNGCRVQVAFAPAGPGRPQHAHVLARASQACGGDFVGLEPTAVAAEELGRRHRQAEPARVPFRMRVTPPLTLIRATGPDD